MALVRIRYKIMMVVGIAVTLGLVVTALYYTRHQEAAVMAQNERTMHRLTESVTQGLHSVMLAGSGDIAHAFAERLKKVPEVADFRILRTNGDEAFRDNKTIEDVNRRRGEELFAPREHESRESVLAADAPDLQQVLKERRPISLYTTDAEGAKVLTFLAPLENKEACYKCHGKASPVRGVLKLSTSLVSVERDILEIRQNSLVILAVALMATMLLTGYMMGRSVVNPIEQVTAAMARVSSGDLDHRVPISGRDELGKMASSFNHMTSHLKGAYDSLKREQDKLSTIIYGAGEGIVVTDGQGQVVLVNPAAERLLGKSASQVAAEGFMNVLDDPEALAGWLESEGEERRPRTVAYKDLVLHVYASTIRAGDGHVVGSAALLRDVTAEKRLEEELRRLSTTDGLTGLYNRRCLDETLAKELNRAQRTHSSLSVVMFDVDHFKKFNDTYGHDQGDRVLQTVAKVMRDTVRKYDMPCRYGGEEFLVILPNTLPDQAFLVAERLRTRIEATEVDGLRVTISLGVATYPHLPADSPEALVELADRALYRSKEGGRNRSTLAEPAAETIA